MLFLKSFMLFRFTVVGSMRGCLLISSFPSIGLQVLQRFGWLGLRFLGRGFLGRELGLGVD